MLRIIRSASRSFVRPFSVPTRKIPPTTTQRLPIGFPVVTTFHRSSHTIAEEPLPTVQLLSSLRGETAKLRSYSPRINRFLDCMEATILREEIKADPPVDFLQDVDKKENTDESWRDMSGLYIKTVGLFGDFVQHIGEDVHRFGIMKMQMQNASMLSDEQMKKLLINLDFFITRVKKQIEEIITTARALCKSWIRFNVTYSSLMQLIESIKKDEDAINALDFSGKPRFATVLKSIDKDLQAIRQLLDKLENGKLSYEENWKVFYLTDKWAWYIEKCREVTKN